MTAAGTLGPEATAPENDAGLGRPRIHATNGKSEAFLETSA